MHNSVLNIVAIIVVANIRATAAAAAAIGAGTLSRASPRVTAVNIDRIVAIVAAHKNTVQAKMAFAKRSPHRRATFISTVQCQSRRIDNMTRISSAQPNAKPFTSNISQFLTPTHWIVRQRARLHQHFVRTSLFFIIIMILGIKISLSLISLASMSMLLARDNCFTFATFYVCKCNQLQFGVVDALLSCNHKPIWKQGKATCFHLSRRHTRLHLLQLGYQFIHC
jgi:hypothetical protein